MALREGNSALQWAAIRPEDITPAVAVAVGHFVVCWACSAVWRCKSSGQPDGGEGLVRCKGYRREAGSERSMDQMCESMDKNRIQGVSIGRAGDLPRSPYPSKMRSVDPTAVHGRLWSLPQEICSVSLRRLRSSKDDLTAEQKSAEGILCAEQRVCSGGLESLRRSDEGRYIQKRG